MQARWYAPAVTFGFLARLRTVRTAALIALLLLAASAFSAENLKLNPKLDYSSDSLDGPLITGEQMDDGALAGVPNYILMVGEG
jgi:hypothetical protein